MRYYFVSKWNYSSENKLNITVYLFDSKIKWKKYKFNKIQEQKTIFATIISYHTKHTNTQTQLSVKLIKLFCITSLQKLKKGIIKLP